MNIRAVLAVIAFSVATCAQQVSQTELRVDTAVAMAHQNNMVEPVYPAAARAAGIKGTVWVETHIGADGRVHQAMAVSGPIELRQAAVASVLQRTFIPFNRGMSGSNAYVDVVAQLPIEFQMPSPSPIAEERDPRTVAALPEHVRDDLSSRGCRIPRYVGAEESGYAKGSFRSPKSRDFAVVCHNLNSKRQQIIVYSLVNNAWKGEVIDDIGNEAGPSDYGCYWDVSPVAPASVRESASVFGFVDGPDHLMTAAERKVLASLDHESVGVGVCEKAGVDYYFDGSRWWRVVGTD